MWDHRNFQETSFLALSILHKLSQNMFSNVSKKHKRNISIFTLLSTKFLFAPKFKWIHFRHLPSPTSSTPFPDHLTTLFHIVVELQFCPIFLYHAHNCSHIILANSSKTLMIPVSKLNSGSFPTFCHSNHVHITLHSRL